MRSPAPGEIVVDEEARCAPALHPSVVQPSDGRERIRAAALQYDRESRKRLLKVAWPKQAFVPGERGIEVVHQILREDLRVSSRKRIERLRRKRIEHWVDGVGPRSLQPGVRLKTKPGSVVWADVVIDSGRLHLLVVVAGVRNALPVRATVTGAAKREAKYRRGCAAGISIELEHLLIEQTILIRVGPAAGCLTPRKLLQDVLLECRSGDDRRRYDGQCDPHPFAVEKEKQLVARKRPTHAAPKVIHGRSRLASGWLRIGEVVRRIQ